MYRGVLLAAWFLFAAAGSALAQQSKPDGVVAQMYKECNSVSIFFDAGARKRFLSRRLQESLLELDKRTPEGEVSELDFDPVSDSQDPDVRDLKLRLESETGGQAVVVADFQSHQDKERTVLRYQLTLEDGAWKVDDIVAGGKAPWRVSAIIARH